jgi:putative DNA primase/helicase
VAAREVYDRETGLLFDPRDTEFPPIPENPTYEDAQRALRDLYQLIYEFPFVEPVDQSVAYSALLTGCVRPSLDAAPMHAVTAPAPGTGKSILVEAVALLATGEQASGVKWSDNDEENGKILDAALQAGSPLIVLDNVQTEIRGARLNQIISQQMAKFRPLGRTEEIGVACRSLVLANGNNLTIAADMTRRTLLCRMDAKTERPEEREFKSDPRLLLRDDRGRYVAAALTILRAFHVAGRPVRPSSLESFGEWSDLVRGALIWLGEADPVASMDAVRANDPLRSELQAVIGQWDLHIGDARVTSAQIIETAIGAAEFREALLAVAGASGSINTKRLGQWLRGVSGKRIGRMHIAQDGRTRADTIMWRLNCARPASEAAGATTAQSDDLADLVS